MKPKKENVSCKMKMEKLGERQTVSAVKLLAYLILAQDVMLSMYIVVFHFPYFQTVISEYTVLSAGMQAARL
jgi:hypothetical protein